MKTEIVRAETPSLALADEVTSLLSRGDVVALPTETVYGLAADALNPIAVAKIFEAKQRPRFDPLIVHLPDRTWLEEVAEIPVSDCELVIALADRFWPGPFTMILPKRAAVPDIVTAGLDTIAVRISAHPIFADIIRRFGKPLAAPSANRFGRISPTTAQDVIDELGGRIGLIVDGGPTQHGIESTVVTVCDGQIQIQRLGAITAEEIEHGIGIQPRFHRQDADATGDATVVRAPGQLPSHYAPETPLRRIAEADSFSPGKDQRVGLLAWKSIKRTDNYAAVRYLSEHQDLREAAANLFRQLRELDALQLDLIVAEQVPEEGLGRAIMDRLRRAAGAGGDAG